MIRLATRVSEIFHCYKATIDIVISGDVRRLAFQCKYSSVTKVSATDKYIKLHTHKIKISS